MIERYTRKEMGALWAQDARFEMMLEVETAVALAQAEEGIIPLAAAKDIQKKGRFNVARILELEATTKHDVIAFVSNVAENVGKNGRFVHFGLTSSDVLDTALSLQIKKASLLLEKVFASYRKALLQKINEHKNTLCAGRTHGMHAEPTTFGLKLAGFLAEFDRAHLRLQKALTECQIVKLSGAVGTYSAQSPEVEKRVADSFGFSTESIATQVIPRDRHADLFNAMALAGAHLERLSVELRHLQRTEVGEVVEGFQPGQKGSSAMPHKKNPISSENLTGVARLLRGYAQSAMESVALWHERDISHSSVERVIFPDAFILIDYAFDRMTRVLNDLYVDQARMAQNMLGSQGQLYSSHVLLALVQSGLSREDAYKLVQRLSHGLKQGDHLRQALLEDKEASRLLKKAEIESIFSGKTYLKSIDKLMTKFIKSSTREKRGKNNG